MHEPPEPGHRVSYLDLVTLPSAPFWARRQTQAVLSAWQLPPDTIDTAQLLVSELITNTLQAAGRAPAQLTSSRPGQVQRIGLTLRLLPGRVVIEVSDNDPRPPLLADPGTDAESGRGLMLVDALSKEWSYYFLPAGGKVVYCVLSTPDEATHHNTASVTTHPSPPHPGTGRRPCNQRGTHMSATLSITGHEPPSTATAASSLLAIADDLTTSGFAAQSPIWDGSAYLKITNARGALCDLTITADGTLTWEYRSHQGSHINAGQITRIVLDLLSPGTTPRAGAGPAHRPGATLVSAAGRALAACGLRVTLKLIDQDHDYYETYAEIHITNPVDPARGTARITDDGDLTWQCHARGPAGGITPAEIADTINRALTRAQHTPCHA